MFFPSCSLRQFCYKLATSHAFQTISFAILLLGSLALAMEVPIPSEVEVVCTLQVREGGKREMEESVLSEIVL